MREADRQGYLLIKTVNGKKDFIFFFRRFHLLPFSELSPINLDVGPRDRFRERLKDIDKVVFALKGKEASSHSLRNVYHGFNVFAVMYIMNTVWLQKRSVGMTILGFTF